jgi:hypothetical protein
VIALQGKSEMLKFIKSEYLEIANPDADLLP